MGNTCIRPTTRSGQQRTTLTSELTDDGGINEPARKRHSSVRRIAISSLLACILLCHQSGDNPWWFLPPTSLGTDRPLSARELGLSKGHSMNENGDGPAVMSKTARYDPASLFEYEEAISKKTDRWYADFAHRDECRNAMEQIEMFRQQLVRFDIFKDHALALADPTVAKCDRMHALKHPTFSDAVLSEHAATPADEAEANRERWGFTYWNTAVTPAEWQLPPTHPEHPICFELRERPWPGIAPEPPRTVFWSRPLEPVPPSTTKAIIPVPPATTKPRKITCPAKTARATYKTKSTSQTAGWPMPRDPKGPTRIDRRWQPNSTGWIHVEQRKPDKDIDQLQCVWLDFYSGMCPMARWLSLHAEAGLIEPVDAYFAFEKDPIVRQIAMHMNPKTDFFPGITFIDDVKAFDASWLSQFRKGAIKGCSFAPPCVDFSKLRLLRNFKGELPDPATARPGLNGPNGKLTRLSIKHWKMIQEAGHSPYLVAENVPFEDLDDGAQWAEVEEGWGVPAMVHNSALNAKTWRNRAWWLQPQPKQEIIDQFGPLDVNTVFEDGWRLDPASCATVTRSWTRGTEDHPEQGSERKMMVKHMETGETRPPTVEEVERMMDYGTGTTAAPGVSLRQRLQALGNAWCYRTIHMLACSAFGLTPAQARILDPAETDYASIHTRVSERPSVTLTAAKLSARLMGGHEPDDLDRQCKVLSTLYDDPDVSAKLVFHEIIASQSANDVERTAADFFHTVKSRSDQAKRALEALSTCATTDDEEPLVNTSCFDTGSEGTFDPNVVVEDSDARSNVGGWTGEHPITTEGAGYLPISCWDLNNCEWYDFDLDGERTPLDGGLESLFGHLDIKKIFRTTLGAEVDGIQEDSFIQSVKPIKGKYRRTRLGTDSGGKLTLQWKLRTGDRAKRVFSTKHEDNQYSFDNNYFNKAVTRAANTAMMMHRVLESIAEWDKHSPAKKLSLTTSNSLRAALKENEEWVNLHYVHKALGHISPARLRWTLKRAIGTEDPGPIPKIICSGCMAHKSHRPELSQMPKAKKRHLAEIQALEIAEAQSANDQQCIDSENDPAALKDNQRPALRANTTGVEPGSTPIEGADADSGYESDEKEIEDEADALRDFLHTPDYDDPASDPVDEDNINNEDVGPMTAIDEEEMEILEAQLADEDPEQMDIHELEILRKSMEQNVELKRIPKIPRFENALPLQILFCDFKAYKKAEKVYGGYIGEMMFADYASQMRDVVAVPGNKQRHIYNAVKEFLIRHGIPMINEKQFKVTMYCDGCGSNKKWVKKACNKFGIRCEFTPPWRQELNEAEKVANIVWSNARALIEDAKLPNMKLLPFAVRFIVQRHYISATNHERLWKSPYEIINGKPPTIKIRDLPAFYTKCWVPSTKERREQLAQAARRKKADYKFERAETGRYLCNEHILSKTPRAILDRTGAVVGSKALRFQFGDDTYSDPKRRAPAQVITHDTLEAVGLPTELIEIMPQAVPIGPADVKEAERDEGNEEPQPADGWQECFYADDPKDRSGLDNSLALSPSARDPYGGYISSTSPSPAPCGEDPVADITNFVDELQAVSISPLRPEVEWDGRRENEQFALPDHFERAQSAHQRSGTEGPGPEASILPITGGRSELRPGLRSNTYKGTYLAKVTDGLQYELQGSNESKGLKNVKVYHVVSDYIDNLSDNMQRARLEGQLDAWYHSTLNVGKPDNGTHIKRCNVTELRRAYITGVKAQADMDWKKALTDEPPGIRIEAIAAKDKEIDSLCKNILTALSEQSGDYEIAVKTATNCRMLLAVKRDGTVKCRLVKQGFRENLILTDGPDFNYSSNVVKLASVRMALSRRRPGSKLDRRRIAVKDISTAFLQSHSYADGKVKYCKYRDPVDRKIYYYRQSGPIYGEAAAPMLWEETVAPWIESLGFVRGKNEKSVFYHPHRDLIVLLYVDDCFADGDKEHIDWFFSELDKRFECKPADWLSEDEPLDYLGMEISIDEDHLWIGMPKYIEKMVEHLTTLVPGFNIGDIPKKTTPMKETVSINEDGNNTPLSDTERRVYQTALGMTGWLTQTARPDIAYAQSRLAQHAASPCQEAMTEMFHLVRYLHDTKNLHLRAPLNDVDEFSRELKCPYSDSLWSFYSDTDHAGNREIQNKRRSQNSRYVFHNGMPVDYKSSVSSVAFAREDLKHATADMSSGAAEIYGAANATLDCCHLQYVSEEMELPIPKPIYLQVDNTTAISFAEGTVKRSKLKHIDCRQEWVSALRDKNIALLKHVGTKENLADLGTKPLGGPTFLYLRDKFMFEKVNAAKL